jgi:hypothetical protein
VSFENNHFNDITCTPSQEFYDANAQHWTPALQLCIGDELLGAHGKHVITSIEFIKKPLKVYMLEVGHTHNFFVGRNSILTHNMPIPWALSAGLGISFGAGAAAGGTAGGCFGPITLVGGAVIGGIICAGIKIFADDNRSKYSLHFDVDKIRTQLKWGINHHKNGIQIQSNKTTKDGSIDKSNDSAVKTVEDLIKQAKPGEARSASSIQYELPGSYDDALGDFESLGLKDIRDISNSKGRKKVGVLDNGQKVVVRDHSDSGAPTLEIQKEFNKIKFRYKL